MSGWQPSVREIVRSKRDEAVWITECELAGLRLLNMEALVMISVQCCRSRPQLQNKALRDAGILV